MMGIPIVRGRGFRATDGDDRAPIVVVVNETMATRYWADGNPIGRQLRLARNGPALEVVGVAKDSTYYAIGETPRPYFYVPFGPVTIGGLTFQLRTTDARAEGLAAALRRELRAPDARVRVPIAMGNDQLRQLQLYPGRAMASISGTFGVLALLLTVVGLYGVVMYSVSQRTREFAVRIALGAQPGDIVRGVLGRGLVLTAVGAALGIGIAALLVRLLRGFLFGVSSLDPVTLGVWIAVLVSVSMLAAYLPARRATRIDAAAALAGRAN